MQLNKNLLKATLLTAAGFAAVSANASGTEQSEFNITTTVTSVCQVEASAAAISFTDIAAGTLGTDIANKKSSGDISVMCSTDAPYVINLSTAGNSASTTGEGLMIGTKGDTITYQLNSDAEGKVWGNTGTLAAAGNSVTGIGTGVSTAILHSVYATITGSTDVKQDTYTDTITASVIY